jgi:UDP-N-acetylmuramoyl-L-alanyl-D-glutamate--2,6-diaminopimelate ligase
VFGCGGDRDPGKRAEMGEIARAARRSRHRHLRQPAQRRSDAIARRSPTASEAEIVLDRRAAIRRAINEARPGDTVVVAGKGHETYQIVGDERVPFDDRDEVRMRVRQARRERHR